jgi:phage tail-like protein
MADALAPIAALYVDNLRFTIESEDLALVNTVPQHEESNVRSAADIYLQIAAFGASTFSLVKVWVEINGTRALAYDKNGGGFQAGWNGTDSSASYMQSIGSSVVDQAILTIDPTTDFPSNATVTVDVRGVAGAALLNESYTFTTEYIETPTIDEILWLDPRKARLHFREPMQANDALGGTLFLKKFSGGFEYVAPNKIKIRNETPVTGWIGYWIGLTGSVYPHNNGYFRVEGVDSTEKEIELELGSNTFTTDTGIDVDVEGNTIRTRTLRAVMTSFRLEADLASEDADEIVSTYEPVITALRLPRTTEIPTGADSAQYAVVDFHDDISYGRKYKFHVANAENSYGEVADETSIFSFTSPTFGLPADRLQLWDTYAPNDHSEDRSSASRALEKITKVLQDLFNVLWHRCDSLENLLDPFTARESWLPHMLYSLGNPFRFPLNVEQQRLLASVLPTLHKFKGAASLIEDALAFFLGGTYLVKPLTEGGWWTLGSDSLGVDTYLGPNSAYARNSYEVLASQAMSDEEEANGLHIAETLDPWFMHCLGFIEPGEETGTMARWTLGFSALGYSTKLTG